MKAQNEQLKPRVQLPQCAGETQKNAAKFGAILVFFGLTELLKVGF